MSQRKRRWRDCHLLFSLPNKESSDREDLLALRQNVILLTKFVIDTSALPFLTKVMPWYFNYLLNNQRVRRFSKMLRTRLYIGQTDALSVGAGKVKSDRIA
jgi:hypothetical protein